MRMISRMFVCGLLVACCAMMPARVEASRPGFRWGPKGYALEDVRITASWSLSCSSQFFSIEEISIEGDGSVEITRTGGTHYGGDSHVLFHGGVRDLIAEFYRSGFFYMDESYPGKFWVTISEDGYVDPQAVSDAYSCKTRITFSAGDYSRTVESWGAAPSSFGELAQAIVEAAVIGLQVGGEEETGKVPAD